MRLQLLADFVASVVLGMVGPNKKGATSSNCGETLKLLTTKSVGKPADGQGNDLGYGNNALDITMDNPQPSPKGL